MKINQVFFSIILISLACGSNQSNKDLIKSIKEVTYDSIKFPAPKFEVDPAQLVAKLKGRYKVERVLIGRPIRFSSNEDYDYWLKVELLNPEIGVRDFKVFGKEIALEVVGYITNKEHFKKVEVSAVTKKGFIITLTSSQNAFYDLDSLRQNPN